jgi:hypothetical protein
MKLKIKKIEPLQAGLILALIYATLGLCIIFPIMLINGSLVGVLPIVLALIIAPTLYGIVGFLGGMLMAFLYNVAAKLIGGVEVQVDKIYEFTSDKEDTIYDIK